ncbi:MAG: hypothetical protein COA79_07070 [Planctomycetota bacterium]|nr:MAG: hypothetical protein COA79_07070 [Planctomycetota bacterium]
MSLTRFTTSSIGRKQTMAITGLLLVGFLVSHLLGNFLIFAGYGDKYKHEQAKGLQQLLNKHSNAKQNVPTVNESKKNLAKINALLKSNPNLIESTDNSNIPLNTYALKLKELGPLLWIARLGLIVIFVLHMFMFMQTTLINKAARPIPYATVKDAGGSTTASKTMVYTGIILFGYILLHLADFTFNLFETTSVIDGVDEGLFGIVVNGFKNPIHTGLYVLAMFILGLHVSHAIQSACQTFGINHPKYNLLIKNSSNGIGIALALGYMSIPIFVLIKL